MNCHTDFISDEIDTESGLLRASKNALWAFLFCALLEERLHRPPSIQRLVHQ